MGELLIRKCPAARRWLGYQVYCSQARAEAQQGQEMLKGPYLEWLPASLRQRRPAGMLQGLSVSPRPGVEVSGLRRTSLKERMKVSSEPALLVSCPLPLHAMYVPLGEGTNNTLF